MNESTDDYYQVLGISREADQKTIKEAFRDLALKFHPDRSKEPGAEAQFKRIAEAYAVLSNPEKKADYDRGKKISLGESPNDLFRGINFEDFFRDTGWDFDFGHSFFEPLFRGLHRSSPRQNRGDDLELLLTLPLEKIARGGPEAITFTHTITCPECWAAGVKKGTNSDKSCSRCGGRGSIAKQERITITIPAGLEENAILRVAGLGGSSPTPNGTPGDLRLYVRSQWHPRFGRDGAHLQGTLQISLLDAVLGSTVTFESLEGRINVKIPAGTQPESILRLKNNGLPMPNSKARGDLLLKVTVVIPQTLNKDERRLYENLRALRT